MFKEEEREKEGRGRWNSQEGGQGGSRTQQGHIRTLAFSLSEAESLCRVQGEEGPDLADVSHGPLSCCLRNRLQGWASRQRLSHHLGSVVWTSGRSGGGKKGSDSKYLLKGESTPIPEDCERKTG